MTSLVIYSRPDCHLCDDMKAVVERVARTFEMELIERDISGDPELERLYGLDVPVLLVDGRKAAKHRVSEWDLRRILAGRALR